MRLRLPLAFCAAACGVLSACWRVPDVERREIRPWLVCDECTSGELDQVVAMGASAKRYLRAAIADGPSLADDSVMRYQAVEGVVRANRYRLQQQVAALPVPSADSAAIVLRQVDDFRLRYRLRAAQALQQIDAASDSVAVLRLCSTPPPELVRMPEYRPLFNSFGPCP